ncbi:MAG: VOC family protein [Hyphomicrobiales bacterium]|nr:VOC family protein [Hyphomicrobiales bacterium]
MKLEKMHHVAYRCKNAKQTVEWYMEMLNMDFIGAMAEDRVPSTHEPDPYMHVFLDAGGGNILAFFELPTKPEMGRDPNTPEWVQHIAFQAKDRDALLQFKEHLEGKGIDVLGVTNHSIFHSIYIFDPNGHRVEIAAWDPDAKEGIQRMAEVKWDMLNEFDVTKKAPKHAAWIHAKEFQTN